MKQTNSHLGENADCSTQADLHTDTHTDQSHVLYSIVGTGSDCISIHYIL